MKALLLFILLGTLSVCKAQEIIVTSTQLIDGKSKFRFKEEYTELFTSNKIVYKYDSSLGKFVSTHIKVTKTKAVFLQDTVRIKSKIKRNKHITALTDSLSKSLLILIQDTSKNSDGSYSTMHVSHIYEHIYVNYINGEDTINLLIFNPEYVESTWENKKHNYHRINNQFDELVYMIMPEDFLLRDALKKRL